MENLSKFQISATLKFMVAKNTFMKTSLWKECGMDVKAKNLILLGENATESDFKTFFGKNFENFISSIVPSEVAESFLKNEISVEEIESLSKIEVIETETKLIFKGNSGKYYFCSKIEENIENKSENFEINYINKKIDGIDFKIDKLDDFDENGMKIYVVYETKLYQLLEKSFILNIECKEGFDFKNWK
jgi:hypothetical protein